MSLFDTPETTVEPSALTAFAENTINRDSEHRTDDCVDVALAHPAALAFGFAGSRLLVERTGEAVNPWFTAEELRRFEPDWSRAILLGHTAEGAPRLAVPVGTHHEALTEPFLAMEGRELYRQQALTDDTLGAFAQAASLTTWNRDNRFCGKCGSQMLMRIGGYKRVCSACEHMIFPRTDPVVIMLTIDRERDLCLMGRSPHFPEGMYSCLAGFLEPGETIENAVRRETFEEAGITVGRVRYHASQPWPMPHSLMIGCYAEAKSFEINRDETELEDCRWFTRDETRAMLERTSADGRSSPPKGAIAHRLMRDWLEM
jgi:NAD+ diphosphatase